MWQACTVKPGSTKVDVTQSTDLNKIESEFSAAWEWDFQFPNVLQHSWICIPWVSTLSRMFSFNTSLKEHIRSPASISGMYWMWSWTWCNTPLPTRCQSTTSSSGWPQLEVKQQSFYWACAIPHQLNREITSENKNRNECWNGVSRMSHSAVSGQRVRSYVPISSVLWGLICPEIHICVRDKSSNSLQRIVHKSSKSFKEVKCKHQQLKVLFLLSPETTSDLGQNTPSSYVYHMKRDRTHGQT